MPIPLSQLPAAPPSLWHITTQHQGPSQKRNGPMKDTDTSSRKKLDENAQIIPEDSRSYVQNKPQRNLKTVLASNLKKNSFSTLSLARKWIVVNFWLFSQQQLCQAAQEAPRRTRSSSKHQTPPCQETSLTTGGKVKRRAQWKFSINGSKWTTVPRYHRIHGQQNGNSSRRWKASRVLMATDEFDFANSRQIFYDTGWQPPFPVSSVASNTCF